MSVAPEPRGGSLCEGSLLGRVIHRSYSPQVEHCFKSAVKFGVCVSDACDISGCGQTERGL